jgi:predicted HicB family RNase H-like nuclease
MKKSRKIDKNLTKQVRIDSGLHQLLKIKAAKSGESIKTLIEGCLADLLEVKGESEDGL